MLRADTPSQTDPGPAGSVGACFRRTLPSPSLVPDAAARGVAVIVHSDNLLGMLRWALDGSRQFGLVYMDPPFCTGQTFRHRDGRVAFVDRWQSVEDYLWHLRPRLELAARLLLPGGSLVVHVDPRVSHRVRLLLDEVMGADAFASEIVWRYRRWPSKTPNFQRVHDVLVRYVKPGPSRFSQLYEPLAESTRRAFGTTRQRAVVADGRRQRSARTDEASPGVPMGDVWDISIVAPVARERTGYPTQKPEALMERLVLSLTSEGDAVLDPYCGSGTTLAVCQRLGRTCVGIDQSAVAVEVARGRLGVGGGESGAA